MKHLVADIIGEIESLVTDQLNYLEAHVDKLTEEDLTWRPAQYKWNIFEVIEHLNRFGVFYLPKLRNVIDYPKSTKKSDTYNSGLIGEFAFRQIRPVNGVIRNKAKSGSKYNPFLRQLDRAVIEEHKEQLVKIVELARKSANIDLSKNRVPTMLGSWIRLNLGDSMRLLVYHAERHYVQIDNLVHKREDE